MAFVHVVLVAPKMPSNTGNIIRLCANTGAALHLVRPLAFDLDDKKLRRAGLDYREYATLRAHDDWASAKRALQSEGVAQIVALTTKLSRSFYAYDFGDAHADPVALVFGSETEGLSADVRADIGQENWLRLPMLPHSRSLNLANSVAVCVYEVWRRRGFCGDTGKSVGFDAPTSQTP